MLNIFNRNFVDSFISKNSVKLFHIKHNTVPSAFLSCYFDMKRSTSSKNPAKKAKLSEDVSSPSTSHNPAPAKDTDFVAKLQANRLEVGKSIIDFSFKKKRVRILSKATEVPENAKTILYWMSRDARVQDNWAFLFAQKLALKNEIPLKVCFCLVPKFLNATIRHYKFLLKGLEEVESDCRKLNIDFHLLLGPAVERVPEFVKEHNVGAVVCDFSPLRGPLKWVNDVKDSLPSAVPITQVDAHNIVPVWVASDKQEYAARTIRNKINSKLDIFLTEFPPLIKHPHGAAPRAEKIDWKAAHDSLECDMSVGEVEWASPGYAAACRELLNFCEKRLRNFDTKRNDPTLNVLSNLSPWYHFGQISVQRCVLEISRYKSKHKGSVDAYREEAIVRRELSDNFCFYNKNYDNLQGIASWSLKTLNDHRKDKRSFLYSLEELEQSRTHDDLWNSAQIQLVKEGKMHGFLRMYWAKKILEWTQTPEEALEFAILLNDKYSLDGRDPNGYVGCMWSIGGIHDQGWAERPVFGKIRYMNYQGCKRKFDIAAYVARYGGKVFHKK